MIAVDRSFSSNLGGASTMGLGWGTGFFDHDNDGDDDLFVANGHLLLNVEARDPTTAYAQRDLLYMNTGDGSFVERGLESGLGAVRSSRGAAFGDYDNDGDTDILVVNAGEVPSLLRNDSDSGGGWVGVVLAGSRGARAGVGARVTVTLDGTDGTNGVMQTREVTTAVGYASASDPRLLFGLGSASGAVSVTVRWPSGGVRVVENVRPSQYITISE